MIVYLDASALVALLSEDALSDAAHATASGLDDKKLATSDLGTLEFASALARQVRMKSLGADGARQNLKALDDFCSMAELELISAADVALAASFIRRFELNLRTADAIHIALCLRFKFTLWTFDKHMADTAHALGVAILDDPA